MFCALQYSEGLILSNKRIIFPYTAISQELCSIKTKNHEKKKNYF